MDKAAVALLAAALVAAGHAAAQDIDARTTAFIYDTVGAAGGGADFRR